jgi:hypothetical protein
VPYPAPEDKAYYVENGEDYYEDPPSAIDRYDVGFERPLHEHFVELERETRPKI